MIGFVLLHAFAPGTPAPPVARKRSRPLIFLLLITCLQPLAAQEKLLPVLHFQPVMAVGYNIRSRVVRDQEGFVWVGTNHALKRFDGYGVKDYRNVPGDPRSISTGYVSALLVDDRNHLWVGTFDAGLSLYDRRTEEFFNLLPRENDTSWYQAKTITGILQDHSGTLWLASRDGGVVRLEIPLARETDDPDSLLSVVRFTTFALGTPRNVAHDLLELCDGRILVGSDIGLLILDPSTRSVSRLGATTSAGHQLDTAEVPCLCRDSRGNIWVGTKSSGVFRLDSTCSTVSHYAHRRGDPLTLMSDNIIDIAEDRTGDMWISSNAGLDRFSPLTGKRVNFLTAGPAPRGPAWMMGLSVDRTGTLWVAANEGVYSLTPKSRTFESFGLQAPGRNWPVLFETHERDARGNHWFSSEGKIYQVDLNSLTVNRVIDVFRGKIPTFGDLGTFVDRYGTYWFGAWGLGLFRVDLKTGRVSNYAAGSGLGSDLTVNSIAQGPGDTLFIAAHYDGLLKFHPYSGRFSRVPGFPKCEAWTVNNDSRGRVWVTSSTNGVYLLDPATNAFQWLHHDPLNPNSLASDHGRRVYEDPSGRVWIGSGNVVHLWDPMTGSVNRYANLAFNISPFAAPMGADKRGRIWVDYLYAGMAVLDPVSGTFTNFDTRDGLAGNFNQMDTLSGGKVFITTSEGLTIFDPDSIQKGRHAPPLVITRVSINDEPATRPVLLHGPCSLSLPYTGNVLEFEFAAIDIDAQELVQYQYRLDGLEKEWVKPAGRRFVRYTSVAPGNYVFRVSAMSSRGEWPDQEITMAISISPPWWRTWWAYGGYGLIFLGMLFGSYQLRLKQLRLKQLAEMEHFQAEHLAQVDRLKSRFFSNISHEFRTPLTLILGPADELIAAAEETTSLRKLHLIKDNAKKLFTLVNQLLDFSRLESGMMRLQVSNSDIVQFLRRVVLSFESWAERKRIGLEFRPDAESIGGLFDADKLEKIVNNLMSNALKFTPEGGAVKVSVSIRGRLQPPTSENGPLEITVSDTGIGIAEENLPHIFDRFYRVDETHTTAGTGIGLALTKELVELHHGTIAAESTPGEGSVFTVTIPIQQSAYAPDETVESAAQIERPEYTEPEASVEKPEPAAPTPPDEGKPIVLIVEDNADLRTYIREYLEAEYTVQEAENGKTGYDRAVEFVPDIVISDVMMPEMDGIELCRALKQDVRTSHVPVILLTARAGTDSKIEGLEIGADDYVTKPFDTKELVARVRNLIEQRQQLRKKFSAGFVLKPGEVVVSSMDDAFLQKAIAIVEKRMSDERFTVEELAAEIGMSRVQVHRKLTALTNQSASEFVRYMRLHRGMELLSKNAGTVSEIAYMVGFGKPSNFARRFQEQFGVLPSSVTKDVAGKSIDRNT